MNDQDKLSDTVDEGGKIVTTVAEKGFSLFKSAQEREKKRNKENEVKRLQQSKHHNKVVKAHQHPRAKKAAMDKPTLNSKVNWARRESEISNKPKESKKLQQGLQR